MRRTLVALATTVAALSFTATAGADGIGPPGGTIYAFDQAYKVIATPTALPNRGPVDTIYVFPDCDSCASVSETAPGSTDYNGGRWRVVAARGITTQLTNAGDVLANATSLEDTGTRFVCPLIPA